MDNYLDYPNMSSYFYRASCHVFESFAKKEIEIVPEVRK